MKKIKLLMLFVLTLEHLNAQQKITINNLRPRLDTEGRIIDAHDGRVAQFGDKFYWYGTAYGNTSGFVRSNIYQCYSSTDLETWKKEGDILPDKPSGIYYRPHVIYNNKTRKYVLWYNWYPKLWDGKFGVAVSDRPAGPFKIVNPDVQVAHSKEGVGDFGIFVDDDNTAYITYNTIKGHRGSVERLSTDYLYSSMDNGGYLTEGTEAGAIFKRKGKYYLLTDYTCCFCTQGSGATVYISDNPMKGYRKQNNINRYPASSLSTLNVNVEGPNIYNILKRESDSSYGSLQVRLKSPKINKVVVYQFTGNREGQCGDTIAAKVHEPIVAPKFNLMIKADKEWKNISHIVSIKRTAIYNIITLNFKTANVHDIRIQPLSGYPYQNLFIREIALYHNFKKIPNKSVSISGMTPNKIAGLPIVPAQQTFVMPLKTASGIQYIWMGDLWGSASDQEKGHDYQYWGAPLAFDDDGNIKAMEWADQWSTVILKQ